ncbi:hypothetical protein [Roseibium alexandrii]|uniref:hypothetical protein n=1 Tax=Roseibium alexandrii TaxID=388408 RepID=UPI0037504D3E
MADYSTLTAAELAADTQTALPGASGVPADNAGTYILNICNDTGADIGFTAIYVTDGPAPTNAHKIRPAFSVEAGGWLHIQPIVLGQGWKVFVEADAACAVQLIGKKEG